MRKLTSVSAPAIVFVFVFACSSSADTFSNKQTGEKLHGYFTAQASSPAPGFHKDPNAPKFAPTEQGEKYAFTQEKGLIKLDTKDWNVFRDNLGRNNKVIVIPVDDAIMYEIETDAFVKAIADGSAEGPLFILVEIDTPGGRVDFAQRMCASILKDADCNVIAYTSGGKYGGAISAGAAVALSCNKIYMTDDTIIGAATLVTLAKAKEQIKDRKYEDVVNEKHSSAWRAYLASLAERNDRPGLLARAMVDSSIEVAEVNLGAKRLFVEPMNKKPNQQVTKTWNKSGSLLTLTAKEAVDCTIADGLADSREQLLQQLGAGDANVIMDKKVPNARRELQLAQRKTDELFRDFDLKVKQSKYSQPAPKFLTILREARTDCENLKALSKRYPDLHLDTVDIEEQLNTINAAYENIVRETRRRN